MSRNLWPAGSSTNNALSLVSGISVRVFVSQIYRGNKIIIKKNYKYKTQIKTIQFVHNSSITHIWKIFSTKNIKAIIILHNRKTKTKWK
jgi:hypothetical protein